MQKEEVHLRFFLKSDILAFEVALEVHVVDARVREHVTKMGCSY